MFLNIVSNWVQMVAGSCRLCKRPCSQPLCFSCRRSLVLLPAPRCPGCALPTLQGQYCGPCLSVPRAYSALAAGYVYVEPLSWLIGAFKYRQRWGSANLLAQMMGIVVPRLQRTTVLVPVPLHSERLLNRGYNQAALLARCLAQHFQVGHDAYSLFRVRATPPQTGLPRQNRMRNLDRVFEASATLRGRDVVLVDDVYTSGATLEAAARAVRKAGAYQVRGWVLARTL